MDVKIIAGFCLFLLYCSVAVESKSVAKTDEKSTSKQSKQSDNALKQAGSGSDDDTPIDCDPEKLKKCNIICEKSKTIEKRTCNCKEEQSKVECAEKRRAKCEGKKKSQCPHGHGVEKRCKSAQGKKKSCGCASPCKSSPLMQRVFRFPALMITPIKSFTNGDKGLDAKKGSKRCGDCCCHHCCCCEPCCCCCCEPCCCCCCHECCCPCCCDCCHHCCHCCHCCPCCCGCCKKSKNAAAPVPAAPNAVAKTQ